MKETRRVHISVTSNAATSMTKGSVAAKGLSTSLKGVGASAAAATGGIRSMTMALLSSGVGALVVGLGMLVAGFGAVISKSAEFSKEFSNLRAIIGADKDESIFQMLSKDARRLGASTAFTATQVVTLQTEFAKLGFTTGEILGATEATLNLAAATRTDLATAAVVAGATLRGFNMDANETGRITDVMALSFSSSTLDIGKFQESMKYVAPVANIMKVSVEEATAALGILADNSIHGSMAGTNLRKVMSELTKTTGKGFRESLEIVAKKLSDATSESEKLAIAQKMVGNRAYGALTILAENRDQLDSLTESLENGAEGYAKLAAEAQLDNLSGDVTKLGSAWEGLLLSMEDGNGLMSRMSRGVISGLTMAISSTNLALREMGRDWDLMGVGLKKGLNWFTGVGLGLTEMGIAFDTFAIDALLALADVPFFGGMVDKEAMEAEKAQLKVRHADALEEQKKFAAKSLALDEEEALIRYNFLMENRKIASDDEARIQKSVMGEFREGEVSADEKQRQKDLENKKIFLAKLKKLTEDTSDKTELEKIERKRERHLAELKKIKMDTTEREKAELAINDIYDAKRTEQELKNKEKREKIFEEFNEKFKIQSDDPLQKLEDQKEAHLAEMELLKIHEDEKALLRISINEYYANLEAVAIRDKDVLKAEEDAKLLEQKKAILSDGLNAVIDAAGQESKVGQALSKIKQALMIADMIMKMKALAQEMGLIATKANSEVAVDAAKQGSSLQVGMANSSKIGAPWNAITMATYAVQAAMMAKNMIKSKKDMKKITAGMGGRSIGGSGGSAPQAPAFNVVGNTSNDANFIGDTIAGVSNRPMRAYVVAEDVTSSQALRRNAEDEASVG